jgi:hypothetical protein
MKVTTKQPRKSVDLVEAFRQQRLAAEKLAADARDLEKKARLARGTERNIAPPKAVVAPKRGRYFVGDNGPTEELMLTVSAMLQERPWTFRDILEQTGARDNRIKGVIMRLQREGVKVVNLGEENKALWFIPDQRVLRRLSRSASR